MSSTSQRLAVLRTILTHEEIESQENLLRRLAEEGYATTQSTLSRALQKLKVGKIATPKGYRYILPEHPRYRFREESQVPLPMRNTGFLNLEFSGNLAVVRTRLGYAQSLCAEIDQNHLSSIAGTIAGVDTILLILREGCERQQLVDELAPIIPAVKSILL